MSLKLLNDPIIRCTFLERCCIPFEFKNEFLYDITITKITCKFHRQNTGIEPISIEFDTPIKSHDTKTIDFEFFVDAHLNRKSIHYETCVEFKTPKKSETITCPDLYLRVFTTEFKTRFFISYEMTHDKKYERILSLCLKNAGFVPISAPDATKEANEIKKLMSKINNSNAMILIWSKHAKKSSNVNKEIAHALNINKEIRIIAVDKTPRHPKLTGIMHHTIKKSDHKKSIAEFVKTINEHDRKTQFG